MTLLSTKCPREGFEDYTDLYLSWEHEGKTYFVRVRPVFGVDNKKLLAAAVHVPSGEPFDKYL